MTSMFSQPLVTAVAWTLAHFVWQGAAIGLAAYVAFRRSTSSASSRYLIGVAALAGMLVVPALTMAWTLPAARSHATAAAAVVPGSTFARSLDGPTAVAASHETTSPSAGARRSAPLAASVVVSFWLCGVLVLSVRLGGGWIAATRLARRAVGPVTDEIGAMAQRLAGRLALDRVVRIAQSAAVRVPMTVGWIRPVVLLPAAALTGLGPDQIEALLAHELAHVRRHDFLVNLLQSVVETLLFFHPAVWWLSREVRTTREECCDDLALGVCDRLVYATALANVAAISIEPRLALAATDGPLLARIKRILGGETSNGHGGGGGIAAVVAATIVALALPAALSSAPRGTPQQVATATRGQAATATSTGVATTNQVVTTETRATAQTTEPPQMSVDRERAEIEAEIKLLQAQLSDSSVVQAKLTKERQEQLAEEENNLRDLQVEAAARNADIVKRRLAEAEAELRQTLEQLQKANAAHDNESAAVLEPKIQALQKALEALESQRWQVQDDAPSQALASQQAIEQQRLAEAERKLATVRDSDQVAAAVEEKLKQAREQLAELNTRATGWSTSDQTRLLSGTMGQLIAAVEKPGSRDVLVLGAVAHPGVVSWEDGLTVDRAIAKAGGRTGAANGGPELFVTKTLTETSADGSRTLQAAGAGTLVEIAATTTLDHGAVIVVPWRE